MATVRVLGAFEVKVDGAAADLGGPRQRSVLARLVAAHGQMVPAGRLVEELWAGDAPPRAAAGLQSFVSHLRRALEPDRPPRTPARVLVTAPPGYALRLPAAAVDAWRFDALVDEAAGDDPAAARRCAEEALGLWRGPAYAEFADLPWAAAETARLDERRRLAVERRAEAMLGLGAAAEAVPDLEAHADANPLREDAWRLLALALYRSGRQGDALAALRRVRATLAEELGVDPGAALRRLERDILAQAPALEPVRPPLRLVRSDPAPAPSFFGRDDELARLADAAGSGGLALIGGDAGMGKTALAERLAELLAERGWTCAWGRASETGAPAAWPWAELLRELAAGTPPEEGQAARLGPLLDDTATVPDTGDITTGDITAGDITTGRFHLHLAVGDYLAGLAARAPLLLVLEDLHWADQETLALLGRVLARVRGLPVLLAGTFRRTEVSDRLAAALAALARHEPLRIDLTGLPPGAAADLVRATCAAGVGDAEAAAIAERTGGNPFFIRETARLLDAEGPAAATGAVPAGVGDVLRRRVARLPEGAQAVLRGAAVVGRDADLRVLAEVAGDEDAVLDAVEAGLASGLITEPAAGRIRFAHALVRDTLYTGLSRARRTRLHGRVAAALERHRPGEAAALAHHYLEAGTDAAKAVRYARAAAEEAEARFAHGAAGDLWCRAADIPGVPAPERLELDIRAIRASALGGDLVPARLRRLRAIAEARALGDPDLLARVIASFDVPMLWTNREYGTVDQEAIDAIEHALAALPPGAGPLRVRLLTMLAMELEGELDDRGRRAAEQAVAQARDLGRPELLAVALNGLYTNAYRDAAGRDERRRIAAELLDLAEAHRLGTHRVLAHLQLHQAAVACVDLPAARAHLAEGRRLAEQYGLPLFDLIGSWYEAVLHVQGARYDDAERVYRRVGDAIGRTGVWSGERGVAFIGVFCARFLQGRAGELVQETGWLARQWPHVSATADLYALALAGQGRLEEARRATEGAGPIRPDYFFDLTMSMRAQRAIALGDRELAAGCRRALLPYAGYIAGGACAVAALGPVAHTLGDLAVFLERPAEAAGHYRRAAEIAALAGAPAWAGRAEQALGGLGEPAA
ncbi:AfsR/SARP family transcriptional regulator [Actinomadura macrotermitis]|uniref:OmpR/PhoB-type domain-containing protein n=1 Tax=Actinomadura macrotermitis TaxID=2585200 RepID=A0A7K0BNG1_9ACTN|nr:AfsR/SARP family transcriptional regulator [Actinomadura macrotermitis]MQY02730.1 hypothetical protein [Actinomadura macrotermitis]